MTITAPRRDEALVQTGLPTTRFANLLEELVRDVNELNILRFIPVSVQDESYTFDVDDANTIVRKTAVSTGQRYTIPAFAQTPFELGSWIEIHNESAGTLQLAIDDDKLLTSIDPTLLAGGTPHAVDGSTNTGTRIIAAEGFARIVLVQIEAPVTWRVTGDQVT